MKFKILTIILIMALGNMVFADDISDVLNKEKNRLSGNTQETTIKQEKAQETTTIKQVETTIREIAKEETTKITETTKETIPKKNNIANKDETTDAYVQNMEIYDGMEFSDLIAEEVIYLNNAKYDYSMFIRILNVDKDTSFIINDGETILNAYSSLKDINEYITRYDFVVFSKYNRKSN